MKNIKPGVLSKIFTFSNTDPNSVDDPQVIKMINISKYLDDCLVKYSNYKPSKKNKKSFIEGNEDNFKNFIQKILEFKYSPLTSDVYKKQKKLKRSQDTQVPKKKRRAVSSSEEEEESEESSEENSPAPPAKKEKARARTLPKKQAVTQRPTRRPTQPHKSRLQVAIPSQVRDRIEPAPIPQLFSR